MESGSDDPLAGSHSGGDDPPVAVRVSERDDPLPRAVVLVERVDAIHVLCLDNGCLRNQKRSVNRIGHDFDPGELSRPEQRVGIGERDLSIQRSGL